MTTLTATEETWADLGSSEGFLAEFARFLRSASVERPGRIVAASLIVVDGSDCLLVRMADGKVYLLREQEFGPSDGSGALSVTLSGDGEYVEVLQRSGNSYEVPWDAILYIAEPAYEFHRSQDEGAGGRAKRIGQKIKEARTSRHMTSTELALRAGMKRPNLSRIEAGRHLPSLETLERIAEALGVPVAALVAV